jgi:16S rRNA processing protein RimM
MVDWDAMVVVGRVGKPHGLRGHVTVHAETDFIEERFQPGAVVWTRIGARQRRLTIASARMQGVRPVVSFEGILSIDGVQPLAGLELRVPESSLRPLQPGRYYDHQLVGCAVATMQDEEVGTVTRVESGPAGSRLVVNGARGEVLIPFAQAICVEVDVAARRIRVDPPEGLLEVNERGSEAGAHGGR